MNQVHLASRSFPDAGKKIRKLVFGVGMMAAALIAVTTNQVFAASSPVSYTTVPFTETEVASWTPDRTAPTGGYNSVTFGGRSNVLQIRLAGAQASTDNFYKTEGLQKTISNSDSIKADLFVDSAWSGKTVRAGLWGVGKDSAGAISSYPIIEYSTDTSNQTGFPATVSGWRYWSLDHWESLPNTSVNTGWNTLEITHDASAHTFVYRINSNIVASVNDEGSQTMTAAILNSKNYGQDYMANWSNFAYGNISKNPISKDDCKDSNWKLLQDSNGVVFKNQGQCVSYLTSNSNSNKR